MEQQLTIRMPKELAERLDLAAHRLRRKRSEVVRLALETLLEVPETAVRGRPADRVRDLLGSVESGIPDLGQRHREHLLRRLRGDA